MPENKLADINALGFASTAEEIKNNFKQVEEIMKAFSSSHQSMDLDPFNLTEAYSQWFSALSKNPAQVMQAGLDFWQKSLQLSHQVISSHAINQAENKPDPVITEKKGDRRFAHEDWSEKPAFYAIKQSYLIISDWMRNLVTDVEGLDEHTAKKVKFFTERYIDAMSPTNFAATNPAVLEKIVETKGANLLHGLKNMLQDLEEGEGQLKIRMTDTSAFTLGENVATTPGKVIFQNRMFQLIQYSPSTDTVLKRPLLIIPPWINKYYIMDLQPKNSLLKWIVDQGHTVFVVSWVNPDETYRDVGFEDYINDGLITAVNAVEQATGENEINAIGYCIGGTLLSSSLAYMKSIGDERIKSATFLTTMIDFDNPGDLEVFIDEEQITELEKIMDQENGLDGKRMSGAFNLLRANDLIWSFYVNNYLLGNDPRPFDLLYWNSDSTRMTPTMHSWYLRNMYLDNKLCKPNGISINNTPIDLATIDIPTCFISTADDHIAPWLATYSGAKLFSGDVHFILGGSGHIAGVINPPEANKYGYRYTDNLPDDPQAWADEAEVHEGSWWPNWNNWIRPLSDNETVPARTVGEGGLAIIEDAPGTYVKCKNDDAVPVLEVTSLDPARKTKTAIQPVSKKRDNKAVKKPATDSGAKAEKAISDDLTQLKGIGPKVSESLNAAGVFTYAQLAALSPEAISEKLAAINARNKNHDTSTWPEQAMALLKK